MSNKQDLQKALDALDKAKRIASELITKVTERVDKIRQEQTEE